jgi:hypothetical protein
MPDLKLGNVSTFVTLKPKCVFINLLCAIALEGLSQDVLQTIDETKKNLKQPLAVTGSLGANSVFYRVTGIAPRRDPFYWVVNANLTFLLFNKISVPFTAVITQQDKNYSNGLDKFSQPFNQFGISPRYKWLTVHAGFRSLELSEYTLSGAIFLGGGIEVKPEGSLYQFTAFYGRFVKAVPHGGVNGIVVSVPAYERRGGGAKIRLGDEKHNGELIFMKIRDDINSLPFDTSLTITPQENDIFSAGTSQQITPWLRLTGEAAFSMLTRNLFEVAGRTQHLTYFDQLSSPRPSSQFNKVLNAGVEFKTGTVLSGLRYKRVDPDYRSLGAVFLTNDVEELSANTSLSALHNRMSLGLAGGVQRNNLDHIQVLTSRRWISSVNVAYNASSHLNLSVNYSNFSSNTMAMRDAFNDSIRFYQLTQNGTGSINYTFGKQVKQTICQTGTYQESGGNKMALTTFFNSTTNYNLTFGESGFSLSASLIYNRNTNAGTGVQDGGGPNASFQKTFFKNRIRLNGSYGVQSTFINSKPLSENHFASLGTSFTLDGHQSLRFDGSYLERKAVLPGVTSFNEIRLNIGYTYSFAVNTRLK